MHILILKPTLRSLTFAAFAADSADSAEPVAQATLALEQHDCSQAWFPAGVFRQVKDTLRNAQLPPPDVIGVRAVYGGDRFAQPVFATDAVLVEFAALASQAPLHVPSVTQLVQSLRGAWGHAAQVLAFETSFFVGLPVREQWYGLDPELMERHALRRFGYQGIFHEAACWHAASQLRRPSPRILSICLEPRPELAACLGRRPVMVTGGNTPVEGLPGEVTCGDLDPSVVLKLAHDTHWGPEEVNRILTCESGLKGLVGHPLSLAELLRSASDELQLARNLWVDCVLRACGAGIAAMGGVDAIVYSGRYADAGSVLHASLGPRLARATRTEIPFLIEPRTLFQHLRDMVRVMMLEGHANRVCAS